MPADHYLILGVTPDATDEEIRTAWRRQVRYWHPDRNPDPHAARRIQLLNHAYDVLSDPVQRSTYDAAGDRNDSEAEVPVDAWQGDGDAGLDVATAPPRGQGRPSPAVPGGGAAAALLDRLDPLMREANTLLSRPLPPPDAVDRWAASTLALVEQRLGSWNTYTQHLRMALAPGDPHMRLAKAQNVLSAIRRDGLAGNIRPDTPRGS